jgi:hypothetical protein
MKTQWKDEVFADFKLPGRFADPVIVSQYLPDGSLKTIGHIYQNFNDDGDITFISTNNNGQEVTQPTTDYLEAEIGFENYARQLTKQSQEVDWEAEANEFEEREKGMKKMRQIKKMKILQINK